jgi:hypothetical protein
MKQKGHLESLGNYESDESLVLASHSRVEPASVVRAILA